MFSVKRYAPSMKEKWDTFIKKEAFNGTFLQSKNFLDYHPEDRFVDHSVIIEDNDLNIYAVIPACETEENGQRIFVSHKGSTYGGPVVSKRYYRAAYVQEMLDLLNDYLQKNGFAKAILKLTPDLFAKEPSALLEYLLTLNGYHHYDELNTYVDLRELPEDIVSAFNANKRKLIKKMKSQDVLFRELQSDDEVAEFHHLLSLNLAKYHLNPVHSIRELLDFRNHRLSDCVRFFGVFSCGKMLAAGMVFEFSDILVAHTQNLSADPSVHSQIDPITFLYYSVLCYYKDHQYRRLSWGISTEEQGKILNTGLIKNKESYNSKYSLNKTYFKEFKNVE